MRAGLCSKMFQRNIKLERWEEINENLDLDFKVRSKVKVK